MTFLWPFSIAIFVYQRVLPSGVIKPRWLGHPRTSWKFSSLGESWNQMVATSNGGISHYKCSCNVQPLCFPTRFAIYGDIYHQYTPNYVSIYTSTMDPMGYIYMCVCVPISRYVSLPFFPSQGMFSMLQPSSQRWNSTGPQNLDLDAVFCQFYSSVDIS